MRKFSERAEPYVIAFLLAIFIGYKAGVQRWWAAPKPVAVKTAAGPGSAALKKAGDAADAAAAKHVAAVRRFFDQRAGNGRAFAERVMGWRSTLTYFGAAVGIEDRDAHGKLLRKHFDETVYSAAEVQRLIERTVAEYLKDLEGIDSQFVIDLRKDVPDSALLSPELAARLQSPSTFKDAYAEVLGKCGPAIQKEVGAAVVAELTSFYAGNVAANGLLRAGAGVGLAVGGWIPTINANEAAGLVIDRVLEWVMRQVKELTGFDPEGEVVEAVRRMSNDLRDRLTYGDREASEKYDALVKSLALSSRGIFQGQREQAQRALDKLVAEENIGLSRQFHLMKRARAVVRQQLAGSAGGK